MFIFNVKLNRKELAKALLCIMIIICIALTIAGSYKIFTTKNEMEIFNEECMPSNEVAILTDENYTNILKEVHENLNTYIGQKISYTGYVYRIPEIGNNQFVLARDMKMNNQTDQTVVVGFLCSLDNASEYETYTWVTITGTIEKGYYLGDIPCINVSDIEITNKPDSCIVPAPRESFVPTATIY